MNVGFISSVDSHLMYNKVRATYQDLRDPPKQVPDNVLRLLSSQPTASWRDGRLSYSADNHSSIWSLLAELVGPLGWALHKNSLSLPGTLQVWEVLQFS